MSPPYAHRRTVGVSFPRVSGDEPVSARHADDGKRFSPRERG